MFDETTTHRSGVASDHTMGLFVSLYLILLAFFIVLDSASVRVAGLTEQAVDSVNETFRDEAGEQNQQSVPDTAGEARRKAELQAVRGLFSQALAVEGLLSGPDGSRFEVQFPASLLFRDGALDVRADRRTFLRDLTRIAQGADAGYRRDILILFGSGAAAGQGVQDAIDLLSIRRSASLANQFAENGLQRQRFASGFAPIKVGDILVLYRTIKDQPEILPLKTWDQEATP